MSHKDALKEGNRLRDRKTKFCWCAIKGVYVISSYQYVVHKIGTYRRPEWTSTHQCTNVDGWCTDRILFSIPVPSQVHFFLFALSQPWSQFSFATLFSPRPPPGFYFFFAFETFPTHYPPLSPIDLLTYIFKLKIDSSPSTYSPINLNCATSYPPTTRPTTNLPTNILSRYLPNSTYMATPTYVVATIIDPPPNG